MAYQDGSQRNSNGPKVIIASQIHKVESPDKNAAFGCTTTPQEIMSAAGNNFENQGGASWDAVISPFQIGGSSSKLPTMPTSPSPACVVSQSNHVDPPINEWTPPVINISYLNPFKRDGDPVHGQGDHYDGTILFNGDKNDGQNIPNVKAAGGSFPTDIRPIALRGPLVIQGWGYDLNGKPIPNKEDDESDARGGTFKSDELKDEFLDDWIQKRETWPVAPVDLRYDRDRKVWTIPNTFRIIQVSGSGEIAPGASAECDPLNINTVYNSAGTEVAQPKVTVTNPSWNTAVASGQSFYAFYDTKDCTYYPVALSGACAPQVTGSGDITVTVSESGGCKTYTVSGCDPIITGTGAGNSVSVTVSETDGCKTYNISGSGGCETRLYGSGTTSVIPTGECSYIVSGSPHPIPCLPKVSGTGSITVTVSGDECKTYTVSGCDPVVTGTGGITVATSETDGCKTYTISGCQTAITGLGGIIVAESGDCGYTISSCQTAITGLGGITIAESGDCGYTISGCQTAITGLGGITIAESGDCGYTISGCEVTITGAGGITTTKEGDCEYTISGCEVTVTGGSGIVVEKEGCEYTVNAEVTCNTKVDGAGCIIVSDNGADPECPEYLIEIDPACINDFNNPHWSLCGSAVTSGADITFTTSTGCGAVTCGSDAVNIEFPKQAVIAGLGSITVAESGDCTSDNFGYTISGCTTHVEGGGSIYVTQSGLGNCKVYTISGSASGASGSGTAEYIDTDYCGWAATQTTCTEIPCLTLGSGLQLYEGTKLRSPLLEVEGTYAGCGSSAEGVSAARRITFGDNTIATKDSECLWTVKGLNQKIVGTEGVCGQDNLGSTDFQKLTFGKNLGVKKDDAGDCDYTISGLDQKIVGTEGVCGQDNLGSTDFQKLTFGKNLGVKKDDAGDCDYTISGLDQKIVGTEGVCGQDNLGSTDFQKLTFGKNLGVKKDDAGDCDYTISGLDQKIVGTEGVCGQDNLGSTDFQKLTFGKNLGVKKDDAGDCDYTISGLDQRIAATGQVCGNVDLPAADFQKLTFGRNLDVKLDGGTTCDYSIGGLDQQIQGTYIELNSQCAPDVVVPVGDFKKLIFADNNMVTDNGNCVYTISGLDQKVSSSEGFCPPQGAVASKTFTELNFSDNLSVDMEGTTCTAIIKGLSQQVMAAAVPCMGTVEIEKPASGVSNFITLDFQENIAVSEAGDCKINIKGLSQLIEGTEAICGLTDVSPEATFRKLTFADNLGVEMDDPTGGKLCEYTIKGLDQKVSSTAGTCNGVAAINPAETFKELYFEDNISVSNTSCVATIKGLDQKIYSTEIDPCIAGSVAYNGVNFTSLNFTDNIGVTVDALDTCKYTIKGLDQKIQATNDTLGVTDCIDAAPIPVALDFTTLDFLENIEVTHDAATCKASIKGLDQKIEGVEGNCSLVVAEDNFTKLQFADGLDITKDDCAYKIQKVLKISDWGGEKGDNHTCELELGCGLIASDEGDGKVKIELDPIGSLVHGSTDVQFVSDICCSGSGFDIKYRTMTFSDCGLFAGVTDAEEC